MISQLIISPLVALQRCYQLFFQRREASRPDLHTAWQHRTELPDFVQACPVAQRYLTLLGPLAWGQLPERNLQRNWGQPTIPYALSVPPVWSNSTKAKIR